MVVRVVEEEGFERSEVIEVLSRMGALTIEQVAVLLFGESREAGYKALKELEKKNLVILRKNPRDGRTKYAVLSKKGLSLVGCISPGPLRAERAVSVLDENEVYVRLVSAGVPTSMMVGRVAALERLGISPRDSVGVLAV